MKKITGMVIGVMAMEDINIFWRWKPVAEALIKRYKLSNESSVLDVGCGKAYLIYELKLLYLDLKLLVLIFQNTVWQKQKKKLGDLCSFIKHRIYTHMKIMSLIW